VLKSTLEDRTSDISIQVRPRQCSNTSMANESPEYQNTMTSHHFNSRLNSRHNLSFGKLLILSYNAFKYN